MPCVLKLAPTTPCSYDLRFQRKVWSYELHFVQRDEPPRALPAAAFRKPTFILASHALGALFEGAGWAA